MRALCGLLLSGALAYHSATTQDAATPPHPSASSASTAASPPTIVDVAETDFEGMFNGAHVYATLQAHGGTVTGSCFYDAIGADIPLRGVIGEGASMTVSELGPSGPVSTIQLTRTDDGAWLGTWKSSDGKFGAGALAPIAPREGDPVRVVTRRVHRSGTALCGTRMPSKVACAADARVPVVLGLADRAFEQHLDERLAGLSAMSPPDNDAGLRVRIDYKTPVNRGGIVSFEIEGHFLDEASCERKGAPCNGFFTYSSMTGRAASLTAAVDTHTMTSRLDDLIDTDKAHALLRAIAEHGQKGCVTNSDLDGETNVLTAGVLTETGVAIPYDLCTNHVHSVDWFELSFAKLGSARRRGSPFGG
jgi:hypothetical protein